ncbi:MAG: hypothetical protein GY796_36250 [Chloroflexi bacterium]|nr:hypothetical protein [Chloroflexota bacterium]
MKYEIRLESLLPTEREMWFEGWRITHLPEGDTLLIGEVQDQVALHGILAKIHDLNIPIHSVKRIKPSRKTSPKKECP